MTLSSPRVAVKDVAFALPQQGTAISLHRSSLFNKACSARPATCRRYCCRAPTAKATPPGPDDPSEEQSKVQRMRSRLEGLFGSAREDIKVNTEIFDGVALRDAIRERWGVEYDVQPQRRHGRVYVQIMWRYFEQQSFYMEESEFASHCEAVAQLLKQWKAVDYFCDYIASVKKRPVVGVTINIPIPGVDASSASYEF